MEPEERPFMMTDALREGFAVPEDIGSIDMSNLTTFVLDYYLISN
jgi:hypothetical protein